MILVPGPHDIETSSGVYVNVAAPEAWSINVEDIAHALSQTIRFGGHGRACSVAEHAVRVAVRLVRAGASPEVRLAGLHHDDPEAYLMDVPKPLKPLLGEAYVDLTQRFEVAIADALGLPDIDAAGHVLVKLADEWALAVEAWYVLPSRGQGWRGVGAFDPALDGDQVVGVPAAEAEERFLAWHRALTVGVQERGGS